MFLREFLRRSFGAPSIQVAPNSKSAEAADVSLGERRLGTITVDDEDGDRSFAFEMKVPVGRPVLQDYLRRLFENNKLTIAGRAKKTDSVELNNGPEFLGVVSADDAAGSSLHSIAWDSTRGAASAGAAEPATTSAARRGREVMATFRSENGR